VRLVEFMTDAGSRVGVTVGDGVCDLTARYPELGGTVHELLQHPAWLSQIGTSFTADLDLQSLRYRAVLGETGRVFAAGLNYSKIYPAGKQPPTPTRPPWFSKMPGTLVAHNEPVVAPEVSETFDYEAELAAVIGTGGRHITVDDALHHVAGWTCLNDGSVREWQRHSVSAGKNFERSGSIGPWVVTADEVDDPQDLRLIARVDGQVRQDANTSEMIFTVAEIISYLSQSITLRPGDVVATGSPEGTGGSFDPPRYLKAGQLLEVEIEGIGVLVNPVISESQSRGTSSV